MAVNVLSNALLRGLNGTGRIRTWTKPFDYVSRMAPVTDPDLQCCLKRLMFKLSCPLSKFQIRLPTLWCT